LHYGSDLGPSRNAVQLSRCSPAQRQLPLPLPLPLPFRAATVAVAVAVVVAVDSAFDVNPVDGDASPVPETEKEASAV
jgi:hypothetical protein